MGQAKGVKPAKKQPSISQFFGLVRSPKKDVDAVKRADLTRFSNTSLDGEARTVDSTVENGDGEKESRKDGEGVAQHKENQAPEKQTLKRGFEGNGFDRANAAKGEVHAMEPVKKKPRDEKLGIKTHDGLAPSGSTTRKLTPLEKQFIDMKRRNGDKVLAIQVGYKFKFFGQDAVIAAGILNIMLIPGNIELDESKYDRFAYCSIPDNRLHIHLKRLLVHGLKVGVVKQTETAAIKSVESNNKSGLFERKITGVYTKSTYMGDEISTGDPNTNRISDGDDEFGDYVLCIDESHGKQVGIVAVQPITGDIVYDEFADDLSREELETRLLYLRPSEVIILHGSCAPKESKRIIESLDARTTVMVKNRKADSLYASEINFFFQQVDQQELKQVGEYYLLNYPQNVLSCISELIGYLNEFKLSNIFTIIGNVSRFSDSKKYMNLTSNTLHSLEIFDNHTDKTTKKGSLFWLLDHTKTRMGSRLLRKWVARPLVQKNQIEDRLLAINDLSSKFDHMLDVLGQKLTRIAKSGIDPEKSLIKIHYSSTYKLDKINRKETCQLLMLFDEVTKFFKQFSDISSKTLDSLKSKLLLSVLQELLELSSSSLIEELLKVVSTSALEDTNTNDQKTNFFNLTYFKDEDIEFEIASIKDIEHQLEMELERIRKFLSRPKLEYVTNLKETHLIEVRNGKMVDSLPQDWVKINGTKTVSRFRSPEITRLYKKLQYHNEMLIKNCDKAYTEYLKKIDRNYDYFSKLIKNLATFDCLLSFSKVSQTNGYVKPEILDEKQLIKVTKGRNPIIESLATSANYIANDINMSLNNNRVMIITGPNMGGKSSYVRQVALLVIMAQIGCFIPSDTATIGVFDSIFIRMGARDNILRNQSTFMVEMQECSSIIRGLSSRSLVILDEIGRGTGTSDGIALAYSILKYLIEDEKQPLVLFITHFPSLHTLEGDFANQVCNYHMGFVEIPKDSHKFPEIVFLYNLVRGVVGNLYGLNVAKLANIPSKLIEEAYKVAEEMKSNIEIYNLALEIRKLFELVHQDEAIDLKELEETVKHIGE